MCWFFLKRPYFATHPSPQELPPFKHWETRTTLLSRAVRTLPYLMSSKQTKSLVSNTKDKAFVIMSNYYWLHPKPPLP